MKRVLSTILCIIMVLSCFLPASAFAGTVTDGTITESSEIIGTLEPIRGAEITSMREKNSKTYEMSDGTYQCVVYAENVHYEDANGTLQEIDNAIKTTTAKNGYSLTNTANSWYTYFANKLSQDNAVTMEKGDYSISFSLPNPTESSGSGLIGQPLSLIGTTASDAKIAANMTTAEIAENPIYSSLAEDNRVVLYKDVLNNVDISYTVKTGILKEDIILKSASAPNTFEFKLNTTGVTPQKADGTVVFNNSSGETVFELAPMYMEDANGRYSEEITYDLTQDTEGYKLTIVADSNFLLDSKTVYPIVIDPSVMVTGEGDTYDTCADQEYPTKNYYLSENLWTGGKSGTNAMRTYIKFDLPTNISSSSITSAYLRIKKREHETPTIKGYRIVNSWSSSGVTWNNQPGYNSSYATGTATLDTGAWYKLNATTLVKGWRAGSYTNYGFILKEPSESSTSQKTKFYSSDAPSPNKPELVINYNSGTTTYSITYKGNGSTSGSVPSSHSSTSGASVTIKSNTGNLARTKYTFSGWNTNSSSTGTSYSAGQIITMPAANLTLYAKWKGTVTYNANGGSGTAPAAQTFYAGNAITAKTCTFTKSGYHFYCWNTKADGTGTDVKAGTSYRPSGNTTLYAKWVKRYTMSVYYTPGITDAEITRMENALDTTVEQYLNYGILIVPSTPSSSDDLKYRTTSTTCAVTSTPNVECSGTCGTRSECASKHHRYSSYYLNKLTSSQRVLRIVDWALCNTSGTSDGYGTLNGNNMVCNVNKSDLNYLIIHELAHTFGLKDGYSGDEPNCLGNCVMKGRPSLVFCEYCKTLLPN